MKNNHDRSKIFRLKIRVPNTAQKRFQHNEVYVTYKSNGVCYSFFIHND